jgi:uncharacterized membrane protein YecN with MAPEG domain
VSEAEDQLSNQRKQLASKMKIVQEVPGSHTSYWPFALAIALIIVLLGIMTHWIVFGIGVVLVATAAIGWGLENR